MLLNGVMLPANAERGGDRIRIEEPILQPIPAVRVTQGMRISRKPDSASPDYNNTEIVDISRFPKMRGW